MAFWLPVLIGLATGMSLIIASLWCAARSIEMGRKAIPPKARESRHPPRDAANVYGSGSDES